MNKVLLRKDFSLYKNLSSVELIIRWGEVGKTAVSGGVLESADWSGLFSTPRILISPDVRRYGTRPTKSPINLLKTC